MYGAEKNLRHANLHAKVLPAFFENYVGCISFSVVNLKINGSTHLNMNLEI